MIKILFVCHGNICRSPMAEAIMKYLTKDKNDYYIESKATSFEEIGNPIYSPCKRVLDKYHIPYDDHRASRVEPSDYDKFDYIIIMDRLNERNIKYIFTKDTSKVHKLLEYSNSNGDISDPWYTGEYEECFKQIYKGCENFLKYLESKK